MKRQRQDYQRSNKKNTNNKTIKGKLKNYSNNNNNNLIKFTTYDMIQKIDRGVSDE